MVLTETIKEAVWLKGMSNEFGFSQDRVEAHFDSQSVIELSKNSVYEDKTYKYQINYTLTKEMISE